MVLQPSSLQPGHDLSYLLQKFCSDCTVMQVRKLEFLMAEAIEQGHDCVITIGGIQSNHCRATAVAARYAQYCRASLSVAHHSLFVCCSDIKQFEQCNQTLCISSIAARC